MEHITAEVVNPFDFRQGGGEQHADSGYDDFCGDVGFHTSAGVCRFDVVNGTCSVPLDMGDFRVSNELLIQIPFLCQALPIGLYFRLLDVGLAPIGIQLGR